MEDSIVSWLITAVIVSGLFGGILYKESRIHPKEQPNKIERQAASTDSSEHRRD